MSSNAYSAEISPDPLLRRVVLGSSAVLGLVGILLIPLRGRSLQDTLPFGCFLAPAALVALLFGRQVADAYFKALLPPL